MDLQVFKKNLKTNFVSMTVVLHKHKLMRGKQVLFTYMCWRKALRQLQYHLNDFQRLDIQIVLQLSGCHICQHNMFSTCDFMFRPNKKYVCFRFQLWKN